jgi:hypothetical protein
MAKPNLDPDRVKNLLNEGTAEVRRPALTLAGASASVPPLPNEQRKEPLSPQSTTLEPNSVHPPVVEQVAGVTLKRAITFRLSQEVLIAVLEHQFELRSKGARLGKSTVGAVVDNLLRTHPKLKGRLRSKAAADSAAEE